MNPTKAISTCMKKREGTTYTYNCISAVVVIPDAKKKRKYPAIDSKFCQHFLALSVATKSRLCTSLANLINRVLH